MLNPSAENVALVSAAKAKNLDQQKSDFTAEGSPPPGKAGTSVPETLEPPAKKVPHPSGTASDVRKRPSSRKSH